MLQHKLQPPSLSPLPPPVTLVDAERSDCFAKPPITIHMAPMALVEEAIPPLPNEGILPPPSKHITAQQTLESAVTDRLSDDLPAAKHDERQDINVPLRTIPAYSPRKLRVITIGAGFSAMIFAQKLRYRHPEVASNVDHTIYEMRSQVGGTWLANHYPGVQCDVPAHVYAFPFDPNPEWNRFYATGPEIYEYFVRTVKKWDLDRDVVLDTRVTGAYWEEARSQWRVTTEKAGNVHEEYADILISAQGFLNTWKWPDIAGIDDFLGHKVHSASWDHSYDYSNKRIAIIGNGSSGIQILPELAKLPGTQITSYQRSPTWVYSRHDVTRRLTGKTDSDNNPPYSEEEKRRFRTDRKAHKAYRKLLIDRTNRGFRLVSSPSGKFLRRLIHASSLSKGRRRIRKASSGLETRWHRSSNTTQSYARS